MNGVLCISLDTEFFWGVHDTAPASYVENVRQARKTVIPTLLKQFENYGIHATWAVVGAAFYRTRESLLRALPPENERPTYDNPLRSPYSLLDRIQEDAEELSSFLAGNDLDKIRAVPFQEIGTHTFSHYYCNEKGQTPKQFQADLKAALQTANDSGLNIRSLVFPKCEYSAPYLEVCNHLGIRVFRGIEDNWIYNSNLPMPLKKVLRFADAYFPLSGNNCHYPKPECGVLNICGSRIFKPYFQKLAILEPLKVRRICSQMTHAAKTGKVFHLWWHPHNFGDHTEKNLNNLTKVLEHYKYLQERYHMRSMNMGEILDEFEGTGK